MTNYLIIGNGVAGMDAVYNILKYDPNGKITILTEEKYPFYYRMNLNKILSGEDIPEKIYGKSLAWYQEKNIEFISETKVVEGNAEEKWVKTYSGYKYSYDKLLLATGSKSFVPPINGSDKDGVFTLRTMADALAIKIWADKIKNVVIIGGGLLGLEAGQALVSMGKKVTILENSSRLLPRQLDQYGADLLLKILTKKGFAFKLEAKTEEITGKHTVEGVKLAGEKILPCELVIISAGVRPVLDLASSLGVACNRGIIVDDSMQTNVPDIYAAGDVTEHNGIVYGIWPASMEQGSVAGAAISGAHYEKYSGTTMSNKLKVVGVDLASVGDIDADSIKESKSFTENDIYKKFVIEDGHIIGSIMLGDTKNFSFIAEAIKKKTDFSSVKDKIFGPTSFPPF